MEDPKDPLKMGPPEAIDRLLRLYDSVKVLEQKKNNANGARYEAYADALELILRAWSERAEADRNGFDLP